MADCIGTMPSKVTAEPLDSLAMICFSNTNTHQHLQHGRKAPKLEAEVNLFSY